MVVHFRRDHSMRVPRPDLTASIGVPNACSAAGCHADKPSSWVQAKYDAWYGKKRKPHYGRSSPPDAPGVRGAEADLVAPRRRPAPSRRGPGHGGRSPRRLPGTRRRGPRVEKALADPEPLVRVTAVRGWPRRRSGAPGRPARPAPPGPGPLGAGRGGGAGWPGPPSQRLAEAQRKAWAAALDEYEAGQRYMSDLPSGPYNLGNLYAALGRTSDAEKQYRRALAIDDQLFLARANLAMLLAVNGRGEEAEKLLREAHAQQPGHAGIAFNLGLLLAERGDRAGAEAMLRAALRGRPAHGAGRLQPGGAGRGAEAGGGGAAGPEGGRAPPRGGALRVDARLLPGAGRRQEGSVGHARAPCWRSTRSTPRPGPCSPTSRGGREPRRARGGVGSLEGRPPRAPDRRAGLALGGGAPLALARGEPVPRPSRDIHDS